MSYSFPLAVTVFFILPEDFPNVEEKEQSGFWKVEDVFWRAQFGTILLHDGENGDVDSWGC